MRPEIRWPVFGYGFRPLFLASGVFALVAVPVWLLLYAEGLNPVPNLPGQLWHGHEMIYGFIAAAVGGFLLTAVPSWTGHRGFAGWPLVGLTVTWLAGRAALACAQWLPLPLVALLELSYLPSLAFLLAPPLLRTRNRNLVMLGVLAVLWGADALYLIAAAREDVTLASRALLGALDVILLLLTIIGGRIVPSFTSNALRRADASFTLRSFGWVERLLPPAMIALILTDAFLPGSSPLGVLALLLAVLHAVRLSGWRSLRTRGDPILWVLHVGYAWLPLGFALKALDVLGGFAWAQYWLHAFGIGALTTMILAVMTRASLGHTGRPLMVRPAIALAYLLVTLAGLVRVAAAPLVPGHYLAVLVVAAACWALAFVIFVGVYGPILTSAREDGRPG